MTARNAAAWWRERGVIPSILVAAISSGYGVVLLVATQYIGALLAADPYVGGTQTLAMVTSILSSLLIGVAMFSAGIVTTNTFSAIVAGRAREIALQRVLGSSARRQRSVVSMLGLRVGALGGAVGAVVGAAVAAAAVSLLPRLVGLPAVELRWLDVSLLAPPVAVVLTTWAAAHIGSRRVLTVSPMQALGGSVEASTEQISARRGRHAVAIALLVIGSLGIAGGIVVGLSSPVGVVLAFFGGLVSFVGIALAAPLVMPPLLRLAGATAGASAPGRLAVQNYRRYPERSSRAAVGITIGVTLVTMFVVGAESTRAVLTATGGGTLPPEMAATLDTFTITMVSLVAVTGIVAGVGVANLLALSVAERRAELGLLRTLGLSARGVSRMISWEALHVTAAGVVSGLALGTFYGWAGAQSLLGSVRVDITDTSPVSTFVWPAVPPVPLLLIVVATVVVTTLASVAPTRSGFRVTPVEAIRASV
ncbi:FtsX-like permease family protein [Marisediminicola sp. LYQ134]|uniref:FtsX-like permease family protein n=1 Tax=Marisediminicola sp. LYQ134 TaxID=3391061 RepID=UPI00398315F9